MSAHHRSLAARRRAAPGQGDAPTGGRRPAAGGGFLTAGLLAALAISPGLNAQTPPAAPAQTPPATTSSLLEQGRYWQARNNDARAAEAWGRLLQAEPTNAEALYNLGLLELKANRPARAREYLAQLRASGTADLDAARLEQEINLRAGDNPKALEQARLLASSGELDKAVAQYRTVFGGKTPQGRIALEYYGYLGYTNDGWDEARQGLERLQRESPDNVQVSLTLAKLLTRKESTRAEGIRRLARLSSRQDVGGDADESWRAALTWYGDPRPADAPLFEAYLKAHPNDTEIRQQYSRTRKAGSSTAARSVAPSPQDAQLSRAFKELEGGNLDSAEADLTALLQANPNHADALGGMGVLRLKQERPDEAVEFLTRATRQPRARGGWQQVLGVARYWSLNASAERAREAGELEKAQQQLEQAVKLSQNDRTAEVALGGVLAERGQYTQAEKIFRGVLARDKDNLAALQGLVNVLAQTDRMEEALRLVSQLSPADQQKIGSVGQLRATQARNDARKASDRGDYAAAQRLLEDGLRANPDDAWLRLDLARLYLKTGSIAEARGVVDGLLLTNPDDPGALQASALLSAEVQDWDAALKTLDRIPARNRTKDVIDLQKLAWTQYQVSQAVKLARAGQPDQAKAILAQLEPEVAQNPGLLGSLASAYIDAGDNMHALGMLRQAVARTATPDNDLLLQYAVVLLKTDQDAEAAGILRQLQNQTLNDRQTRSFEDLRKLYTVRQADALRQRGRIADAYDVLAPMLAKYPNDPLVVGALARMYSAAGDGAKALALHRQLLEKDPDNAELLTAAAQAAVQARNTDYAEAALAKAVSLQPRNPTVLASVGRVYNSMGRSGKAAEYLKAALAAQAAAKVPAAQQTAAAPAPRANDDNPFASLPGQIRSSPPAQRVAGAAPTDGATVSYGGPVFGDPITAPAAYAAAARQDGGRAPAAATPTAARTAPIAAARASSSTEPSPVISSVRADLEPATVQAPFVATVSAPPPGTVPPPSPGAIPDPVIGLEPAPTLPPSPFRRPSASQANLATASTAPAAPRTLEQELDAIQQARSATITVGTTVRQHNGAGGMGRMLDVETPVTVDFPVGDGRAYVQATPVTLRAGSVGSDFPTSSQFGGGPAAANAQQQGAVGAPGSQNASGVGVAVGYQLSGLKLDLGVTPFGFRYQNVVGGARFDGEVANEDGPRLSYGVEASRRAVTDTVLSYAGVRDSRTGESWGGVTATGGRLRGGLNYDGYGFYGSLGWHSLNGHNVQSNSRLSAGAGFYTQLIREPNRSLTTGLDLTVFGYDKNLGYYTVGSGGYFSPQRFVALSVPLAWAERQGRFSYQVKGAIGVQHIKQDAVNYFSDPVRQAQAQAIAAAYGTQASYAGQSKTGIGYGLALAAEYQLAPKWFLGGNFSIDNARDYRQYKGGVYVRYALESQTGPVPMPVPPFASPYASE